MQLSVQELEAAINFWRATTPAHGNEYALSPEVKLLARVYALMIFNRVSSVDTDLLDASERQVLLSWRAAHPT
jgi:hypothetical protein